MSSWKKVLVALTLVLAVAAAVFYFVRVRNSDWVPVETGIVTRQNLVQSVTATGEIQPKSYVNISSNAFGRILSLPVSEGDLVEEGQFLLQIESVQTAANVESARAALDGAAADLEGMDASIRSAEAALASAEADKNRIDADFERTKLESERAVELLEAGLISREQFERQDSAFRVAEAQVDAAVARISQTEAQLAQVLKQRDAVTLRMGQQRANLTRAVDELGQTTITAPLSGVITYLPVNEGENAIVGIQNQPGTTLMTIADMSVITAEVRVDETDIVSLQVGQRTEVRVDALGERVLGGTVSEIGNTALTAGGAPATTSTNANTDQARDFKVIITLDEPPPELRPGLSSTVTIETAFRSDTLAVPIQAMTVREIEQDEVPSFVENPVIVERRSEGQALVEQEGVFVVDDGVARFQPVVTGIIGTTDIEVLNGLNEDDEIVTGPYRVLRTLENESPVRIIESDTDL